MHTAYWMVAVNIIASSLILFGLIIYRFLYPKKPINLFVLLVLVSLLPIISIFRPGVYESGDLSYHITEEIVFYKSLSEGNIVPIWGGDMNATYGLPIFMFLYPLPYYFMSLIHAIGFSFINSAKVFLSLAFIFSGIFMYLYLKKVLNKTAAFVGSLFYLFAPYHLVDLHFRADIGEVLAYVFIPLGLYTATNVINTGKVKWFFLEAIAICFLLLSHPALSLVGIPTIFLYCLFLIKLQRRKIKKIFIQLFAIIVGILLAAFYWIPLFYNLQYTYKYNYSNTLAFVTAQQLLYSPWRMGLLFQGPYGELSPLVGYTQLLVVLLMLILLFRRKSKKELQLFVPSLLIVVITIFMMLPIAKPLWYVIPLIKNFQFAYRLLGITIFAIAIIAAIVTENIQKTWIIAFFCFLTVFSTILNWGNRKTLAEITDQSLQKNIPYEIELGGGVSQAYPLWSDPPQSLKLKVPEYHIEIIKGTGEVKNIKRETDQHIYDVYAKTPLVLRENTLYFPPWHVYIDKRIQKTIILTKGKPRGIIAFPVTKGTHIIQVIFQDTPVMIFGKIVSVITFIILLIIAFFDEKFAFLFTFKKK